MRKYFLESERIGFSHWEEKDLPLAISLWGEEDVSRFISKSGGFSSEEIEKKLTTEINNNKHYSIQYWPIFELTTGEFIGCCGLRLSGLRPSSQPNEYELGSHLRSKFWGNGIAFEASSKIIDFTFNKLSAECIFAGHHPNNANSKKVLNKLGFQFYSYSYFPPTGLMHPTYILNKPKSLQT